MISRKDFRFLELIWREGSDPDRQLIEMDNHLYRGFLAASLVLFYSSDIKTTSKTLSLGLLISFSHTSNLLFFS